VYKTLKFIVGTGNIIAAGIFIYGFNQALHTSEKFNSADYLLCGLAIALIANVLNSVLERDHGKGNSEESTVSKS